MPHRPARVGAQQPRAALDEGIVPDLPKFLRENASALYHTASASSCRHSARRWRRTTPSSRPWTSCGRPITTRAR